MVSKHRLGFLSLAFALTPTGCQPEAPKFKLIDHVVTGKLTVKSKPGARVKLVLIPVDGGSNAGQVYNTSVGEDGTYTVNSLIGPGGPAEGEYVICASYPLGGGKDQFNWEFNDSKTTPFRATITPETTELQPINIDKYDLPANSKSKPKAAAVVSD